jgi:murein DD-endopeptidase MepM/ murein hydrolase activator NlpD
MYVGDTDSIHNTLSWNLTTPLLFPRSHGKTITTNEKLYYMGGLTQISGSPESNHNNVIFSIINPDGTLGTWTETTPLNQPWQGVTRFGIATTGTSETGYKIFTIGGKTITNQRTNKVFYANVNDTTGHLGPWTETHPLPEAINSFGTAQIGNIIVVAGGTRSGSPPNSDIVYYSEVHEDGSIGPWQTSEYRLPIHTCCGALTASNTHLYWTGGWSIDEPGNYHDKTFYAKVDFGSNLFNLPFDYPNRQNPSENDYSAAFWNGLTAAFDHTKRYGIHIPFTGTTYRKTDCLRNSPSGINCYDSHQGTDFSGEHGDPVYSVASGTVVYSSKIQRGRCKLPRGGLGCTIIAQYETDDYGSVFGLYAHLSKIHVSEGDEITSNDVIGEVGNTGCFPRCGSHLHFGVFKDFPPLKLNKQEIDWNSLLYQIRPSQTPRLDPRCTYKNSDGVKFMLQDPTGWRPNTNDPWEQDCGITSPYLWKYDIGNEQPSSLSNYAQPLWRSSRSRH